MKPFNKISGKALVLLFCINLNLVPAQNEDGLVAKFLFNKGATYNEINSNKAITEGVLFVNDRFGNPKSACYLHGTPGSYINLGTNPALKPLKGTVSLWVNIDIAVFAGRGYRFNPIILTKNKQLENFYEGYTMAYDIETKKISTATSESENLQVRLNSSDTLSLNEWHHLAITYDDEMLKFYFDGKEDAKVRKNFRSIFSETDSVMVGHSASKKNERFMSGTVDDIYIYSRVLSPEEIYELYNQPNPNRLKVILVLMSKIALFSIFVALLVWIIVRRYRLKIKLQEEKNELNVRLNELETQAIRMQMNPHFMFNSLNTLQRFILEADLQGAQTYLVKFSKLLRILVESSSQESIALSEEIEILKSYVELEKLRFENSFEFVIDCSVTEPHKVNIPFMLIQPIVENAIWHGLLPLKGEKKISVSFTASGTHHILCVVEDNGVGRQKSSLNKSPNKERSVALNLIKQRLNLLQKITGKQTGISIYDKFSPENESEGTRVEIIIPKIKTHAARSYN